MLVLYSVFISVWINCRSDSVI